MMRGLRVCGASRILGALAGAGACLAGAGCIRLIDTSSHTTYTGQFVSERSMQQIEPGKTTADFVLATLGPPTTKSTLDDGSELWKYSYRKAKSSSGSVFLLLDSDNYDEREGAAFVQVKDGIVAKAWRD